MTAWVVVCRSSLKSLPVSIMAHGTTEEEFLYQLNLSKCQNVSRNLKKCINTRSKSKLRKPTHNKSVLLADAAGATSKFGLFVSKL